MHSEDDEIARFLGKHGFQLVANRNGLVISGLTEIPIVKSFAYILLGIPAIIFFCIRIIHLYYDVIAVSSLLWFLFSAILLAYWIKMLLSTILQGRKKWLEISTLGIVGPEGRFYRSQDIQTMGVKTKKLAGVLSAAYMDNHYRKTIYVLHRYMEVELISFETKRSGMEKSIEKLNMARRLNMKIELLIESE
jgi:hypothetical protein